MLSALISFFHLMGLAIGLPAIHLRARFLRMPLDADGLRRVFVADSWWGVAALLWLATGPWRAFGGLEKGTAFYLGTWFFHLKLGLFLLVLLLEIWPMVTLIRWRAALAKGRTPDTSGARTLAALSQVELAVVVVIALIAAFMARGFGQRVS